MLTETQINIKPVHAPSCCTPILETPPMQITALIYLGIIASLLFGNPDLGGQNLNSKNKRKKVDQMQRTAKDKAHSVTPIMVEMVL
jgi:hypothetical protein